MNDPQSVQIWYGLVNDLEINDMIKPNQLGRSAGPQIAETLKALHQNGLNYNHQKNLDTGLDIGYTITSPRPRPPR